jgi:hypothetical protein
MFYGGTPGSFDPIYSSMQQQHQLRFGGSAGVRRKDTPVMQWGIGGLPGSPSMPGMAGGDYGGGGGGTTNNYYGSQPDAGMQPEQPQAPRREPNRAGRLGFGGFRALGGPVDPGKAYIVGENGPELIVPQQPGMVLPNPALPMKPVGPDPRFQAPQTQITPAFQSNGPMMPRGPVESFDYGRRDLSTWSQGGLSARASARDGIVRTGSLADRGGSGTPRLDAVGGRIGSRGMTPLRRMEMLARRAYTRGDDRGLAAATMPLLGMAQQQQGMDFSRERGATNFQQGLQMYGMQQQDQQARDQAQRGFQMEDWQRQQEALRQRDQTSFSQSLMLQGLATGEQAMRDERARQQQEQQRVTGFEMLLGRGGIMLPGLRTQGGDFKQIGGGPIMPEQPLPAGLVPMQAARDGVQYGMPQPAKPTAPIVKEFKSATGVSEYRQWNPQKNGWEPVNFIDANGDGIDDRTQGAATAGATAPAAPPPGSGGGNYFDSLLPAAPTGPTAPTASTQTGQMPNANYAAPLTQEQMLEEARTQYLAGDKGVALQQYFEQFPSAQTLAARQPTPVTPRPLPVVADADKRRVFFTEAELEEARLQREAVIEQEARRSGFSRLSGRLAQGAEKGFVQMGRDIASNASAVSQLPMDLDRALLPLRQKVGPAVNEFFYGQPGTGPAQKALEDFQRMNRR